jgi:hypothetical protein
MPTRIPAIAGGSTLSRPVIVKYYTHLTLFGPL